MFSVSAASRQWHHVIECPCEVYQLRGQTEGESIPVTIATLFLSDNSLEFFYLPLQMNAIMTEDFIFKNHEKLHI